MDSRSEWLERLRANQDLRVMKEGVIDQLQRGLLMHKKGPNRWRPEESDLMCLDSCIPAFSFVRLSGQVYYGIDFGGSNLRFIRGKFSDDGKFTYSQSQSSLRDGSANYLPKCLLDPRATATMLFDFVADSLLKFMMDQGDLSVAEMCPDFAFPVGFTFSFGFTQESLDSAPLYQWSKDFETGDLTQDPVIGCDICHLLRCAFERRNVPARLVGIVNDTAAVLLAANIPRRFNSEIKQQICRVGFVFGTGVNGCYYEPESHLYGYAGKVVNTECGGYNQNLPYTEVDEENDAMSANPGSQRLEKLISGHYLPETIRRIMLRTFDLDTLPLVAREPHSLSCPSTAMIFSLDKSGDWREKIADIFHQEWEWRPSLEDCDFLYDLVEGVWLRSCRLAGMLVSALAEKADAKSSGSRVVGVDGALVTKCARFQSEVRKVVGEGIELEIVQDGSGVGALALAALFDRY